MERRMSLVEFFTMEGIIQEKGIFSFKILFILLSINSMLVKNKLILYNCDSECRNK